MKFRCGKVILVSTALLLSVVYGEEKPKERLLDIRGLLLSLPQETPDSSSLALPASSTKSRADILWEKDVNQAVEWHKAGLLDKAERKLKALLEIRPKSKLVRFTLGTIYIEKANYKDAEHIFSELMEEFPKDFSIRNNLAWLYATALSGKVRNGKKAVTLAQEALLLKPGNFHVWSTLSEAYYISGEYEKAKRAAGNAMRLCREQRGSQELINHYKSQYEKSYQAAIALSIMD